MHGFFWFLGVCVVAIVLFRAFAPKPDLAKIKGQDGERRVAKIVSSFGFPGLHDVYLPSKNGTTQIDHVVRAGNAILVIETKNLAGTVYGSATDHQWRQSFRRGYSRSFLNPVKQNDIHVNAVRRVAGPNADIRSVVVMAGKARFPKGMPAGVIAISDLKHHLRRTHATAGDFGTVVEPWEWLTAAARANSGRTAREDHMRTVLKHKTPSRKEPPLLLD